MAKTNEVKELVCSCSEMSEHAIFRFISNGHECDTIKVDDTSDTTNIMRTLYHYMKLQVAEVVRVTLDKYSETAEYVIEF